MWWLMYIYIYCLLQWNVKKNYCKISVVCCSISLKFCICRVVKKKKAVHLHVWRGHRTRWDFWYCIFIFEISNTSMNCTYDLYYIYSWSIALSSQMNTWTITNSLVTKCTQLNFWEDSPGASIEISSLLYSLHRRVQTILLPCHRRLIASTLRRSSVLHRSPGGHTCSLRRRSRDVELCDVELVIINLWCWTLVHLWWIFDGFIKYACACDI